MRRESLRLLVRRNKRSLPQCQSLLQPIGTKPIITAYQFANNLFSYNWKKPQHVLKNNWSSPHLHEADEHPFCIGVAVAPDSFAYTSSCHSLTFKKIEIEEEADRALVNGGLNGSAALNGKRGNKNKTLAKKATKGMKKKINIDAGMALVVRGNQVAVGSNTDLRYFTKTIIISKKLTHFMNSEYESGISKPTRFLWNLVVALLTKATPTVSPTSFLMRTW